MHHIVAIASRTQTAPPYARTPSTNGLTILRSQHARNGIRMFNDLEPKRKENKCRYAILRETVVHFQRTQIIRKKLTTFPTVGDSFIHLYNRTSTIAGNTHNIRYPKSPKCRRAISKPHCWVNYSSSVSASSSSLECSRICRPLGGCCVR